MSEIDVGSVWVDKTNDKIIATVSRLMPENQALQYKTSTGWTTSSVSWFLRDFKPLEVEQDMVNNPPHLFLYKDASGMSDIKIGSEWIDTEAGDVLRVTGFSADDRWCGVISQKEGSGSILKSDLIEYFKPMSDCKEKEMINHPKHYNDESGVECCNVTDLMMFNAASCFKYLYRCGNKWDDIEDLKKAIWYAMRSHLTGDSEPPNSLEWDNNVKTIAGYREHGIYKAMTAIRSYSWLAIVVNLQNEITRLQSEGNK